jgi:hypothetical protein
MTPELQPPPEGVSRRSPHQPAIMLGLLPDAVRLRHLRHPQPAAHVRLGRRGEVLPNKERDLVLPPAVVVSVRPKGVCPGQHTNQGGEG